MLHNLLLLVLVGPNADQSDRAELARNLPFLRVLGILWLFFALLWLFS